MMQVNISGLAQKEKQSFYQKIELEFKEKSSKLIHLEHMVLKPGQFGN
jgi:hypothetical protein